MGTAVLSMLLDALLRLHRLGVKAQRATHTLLSASLGRVSVILARRLAGAASWVRTWRVARA